ncbi:hypothetical protein BHE74_00043666 [Ensete ventricosum]|nr:hypothetical protein GW17_00028833 [Ensete ventricosum]RWW50102.1 hypothetical protein BHE74_00043666 [Ensete ventricosum]RZS12191.1 hypothetical protein BHM03_00043602 [Ensete ventricosum]
MRELTDIHGMEKEKDISFCMKLQHQSIGKQSCHFTSSAANTDIGAEYQYKELKQLSSAQFGLFTTTSYEIDPKIFILVRQHFQTTSEKRRKREQLPQVRDLPGTGRGESPGFALGGEGKQWRSTAMLASEDRVADGCADFHGCRIPFSYQR